MNYEDFLKDLDDLQKYELYQFLQHEFTCMLCGFSRTICNKCGIAVCLWCERDFLYTIGFRPIPSVKPLYGPFINLCRVCYISNRCKDCVLDDNNLMPCDKHSTYSSIEQLLDIFSPDVQLSITL